VIYLHKTFSVSYQTNLAFPVQNVFLVVLVDFRTVIL